MILLTGANGFIGNSLRRALQCITVDRAGCDYNGDLADPAFVATLPEVDTVIHLAAFNSTKHFYTNPFTVLESIVMPTMNLLKRYPDAHFVYAGSCEEYASTVEAGIATVPTPEDVMLSINDITNPRWSYAAGKIAMESAVISSGYETGRTWTILRYHNVYGPEQENHFIPEFIDRVLDGDFTLNGGDDTRTFCYIDDAVEMTKKVLYTENEIINIGADEEVHISSVASMIMFLLHTPGNELRIKAGREGSVTRRKADITKLLNLIGPFSFTNMDIGLTMVIEHRKKLYDINNK